MDSSGASSSLPKWQLALAVGAPVALGLGYMYYRNCNPNDDKTSKKHNRLVKENGEKQISIDGDATGKTGNASIKKEQSPLEKAIHYKDEGNKFFNSGKFDEAIAQYNLAIEVCPQDSPDILATFYQNRAAAYEKLKKLSAVKADCTTALKLKPQYVKALIRRARAMESSNDLETALEDITAACILERFQNQSTLLTADKILKQLGKHHAQEYMKTKVPIMPSKHFINTYFMTFQNDPFAKEEVNEETKTSYHKALEALRMQQYDDIIPLCNEELNTLAADDNSLHKMKVILLRGTFYLLMGLHEEASKDLNAVVNSDISSNDLKVNALIKRASMHVQLEDPEKSFDDFQLAENIDPNLGDIYHNRGQVHLLMEKVDEAKADFQKAVDLNPNFGVPYVQKCYADYRYGVSKNDMNLVNSAMTNFQKAFEKFPDCAECYTLYAQMLVDHRDLTKADAYFVKAAKRDPENATILVYRGLLQLQSSNDIEKAVEYMQKAIELDEKCEFAYETLGTVEVQRGNLSEAISLFDKALALARTFLELTHIFSLRDAAKAQIVVSDRLGEDIIRSLQHC
ncbi:mitochondrial import receptor subunit TOM70 [Trichogramma pretiosum]|uniref:mitochondrial import receptor subunit TOM70 n=1 Tax=Trichogramma pretiosum TaxID=7493 RepID=UPI0006C9A747|nr:mitochondrial import receptor subunit TOM70 [Trichogramma pretiosum]